MRQAEEKVEEVFKSCSHPCLGGSWSSSTWPVNSEYFNAGTSPAPKPKQTPQDQQEGRQISADLLALKEVIRTRALKQARIPFRSSPLTMVLRSHFLGSNADESYSAMILTALPSSEQFVATMNTLKYGNLVGVAGGDKKSATR